MIRFPKVSVILPVCNGGKQIYRAIESILLQTYDNFELIVIDDGSKDDTFQVVSGFDDERIKLYRQSNIGLSKTLINAVNLARGEYIARQDHDDISYPERIAAQLSFLEKFPDVCLLGSAARITRDGAPTGRYLKFPTSDVDLRWSLIFMNPFVHSSVMFRKNFYMKAGGYSASAHSQPEDYDLWSRMSRVGKIANLADILVEYAESPSSLCRLNPDKLKLDAANLRAKNLEHYGGGNYSICKDFGVIMSGYTASYKMNASFSKISNALKAAHVATHNQGKFWLSPLYLKFVGFFFVYKIGAAQFIDIARVVKFYILKAIKRN